MSPEALAALHARAFDAAPPPWSAEEFAALLAHPGARLLTAPGGFALLRHAGGEAELLTLAVALERRRQGIARALLARALAATAPDPVFLEVAAANAAARALYAAAGFTEVGRRPGYYGPGADALVLRRGPSPGRPS